MATRGSKSPYTSGGSSENLTSRRPWRDGSAPCAGASPPPPSCGASRGRPSRRGALGVTCSPHPSRASSARRPSPAMLVDVARVDCEDGSAVPRVSRRRWRWLLGGGGGGGVGRWSRWSGRQLRVAGAAACVVAAVPRGCPWAHGVSCGLLEAVAGWVSCSWGHSRLLAGGTKEEEKGEEDGAVLGREGGRAGPRSRGRAGVQAPGAAGHRAVLAPACRALSLGPPPPLFFF